MSSNKPPFSSFVSAFFSAVLLFVSDAVFEGAVFLVV